MRAGRSRASVGRFGASVRTRCRDYNTAMTYDVALEWLFSLQRFGMKLGLDNIRTLTGGLGRPQDRFASVLIAGTNGKGSTAAILHQILLAAGVRSGLYTSPHLVRTEERIRIGSRDIECDALASALTRVRTATDDLRAAGSLAAHPTFFETITAAAFVAFADAGVEVAVLEVGLGGRYDATNVVSPVLSIITNIDLDHQEQLGASLAAIAREKAGVLRPRVPTLVGEAREEPLGAIREEATAIGARLIVAGSGAVPAISSVRSVATSPSSTASGISAAASSPSFAAACAATPTRLTLSFETPVRRYARLSCPLPGAHQAANVSIAVRAAEFLASLGWPTGEPAIVRGVAEVRWPGRLEWIAGRPSLLLDGAHNPAGVGALAEYLDGLESPPVLLFGSMRDKDCRTMLAPLLPRVRAAVFTQPPMDRAAAAGDLILIARALVGETGTGVDAAHSGHRKGADSPATCTPSRSGALPLEADPVVTTALTRARSLAGPDGIVLVAGSLFLVGAVKAILEGSTARAGVAQ